VEVIIGGLLDDEAGDCPILPGEWSAGFFAGTGDLIPAKALYFRH